ncbi:galactose-1-phosphate uridylyltransferase [Rhodocytophaga aerolata]|uniref:Galactose-1-phosphate uridylyltransferase n=1 Tax=Rhodocytophaga aerolata TaxID=455078 RepID=A0ABT8R9W0_9BACT|nr:galactose-1-phosphate uridylyltransferase [Rhodocytophaga aerolata]MDO1448860.1 galactose-1-phosphate uridylyltransferase [Rhodocytophaga aerolata]
MLFEGKWEKRWHPLRQEWVIYAAHRNNRPWTTGKSIIAEKPIPAYDPACYLCPGNQRIHGGQNPAYTGVYIFDNDHPVVGLQAPEISVSEAVKGNGLYRKEKALGIARVVCYDPRHNVTLAEMEITQIAQVFSAWRSQMQEFIRNSYIKYALLFENKGELCGVSNPHPHCQIYATDFVFKHTEQQLQAANEYYKDTNRNLFGQIIENETEEGVRIVAENTGAVAFIPFFARYAYEVMIFPKKRHATLATMSDTELYDLAAVFREVIRRYNLNFEMSFPYVMSVQQAPVDGKEYPLYHLHMSILPPLRQPGLVKFLAGPEIGGGNFMADTIPEEKAAELKNVNVDAYKIR